MIRKDSGYSTGNHSSCECRRMLVFRDFLYSELADLTEPRNEDSDVLGKPSLRGHLLEDILLRALGPESQELYLEQKSRLDFRPSEHETDRFRTRRRSDRSNVDQLLESSRQTATASAEGHPSYLE
jgi:hypothetical protein